MELKNKESNVEKLIKRQNIYFDWVDMLCFEDFQCAIIKIQNKYNELVADGCLKIEFEVGSISDCDGEIRSYCGNIIAHYKETDEEYSMRIDREQKETDAKQRKQKQKEEEKLRHRKELYEELKKEFGET